MYIETSGVTAGSKARLLTNYFMPNTNLLKVSFWYHMSGATIGSLRVLRQDVNSTVWTEVSLAHQDLFQMLAMMCVFVS